MSLKIEIQTLIRDCQSEINRDKSYAYLLKALDLSDKYMKENPVDGANEKAYILRELAFEETQPKKRNERWKASLQTLEKAIKSNLSFQLVEAYSYFVADSLQDEFCSKTSAEQTKDLKTAFGFIEQCLGFTTTPTERSILLSRKASIIKNLAFKELTTDLTRKRLNESIRCAELAFKTYPTGNSLLELALCETAIASYETSDEASANRLKSAERHFKYDLLKENENALLSLSRFYRLNYLPKNCCDVFPKSIQNFKNIRKLLRSVHLYAESAISMWFAKFPEEITFQHLNTAKEFLEISISAGYRNARNIVNLAFLQSILGSVDEGSTTLNEISLDGKSIDWQYIIDKINYMPEKDILFSGFVLGIDNCGVWTRLGTFIKTFQNNSELAEAMYRVAIKTDPRNPIALTNLARLLVEDYNDDDTLSEAKRLIQKARNFADRRFCWWRQILSQIEEIENENQANARKTDKDYKEITKGSLNESRQIRRKFFEIKNLDSPQDRGREFEKLFYELAKLTFPVAEYSYNFDRVGVGNYQIDGYFKLDSDRYRVECKWYTKENVGRNDVVLFANKLDAFGVFGVIVSMTDFCPTAIGEARKFAAQKPILLVNGIEMMKVFTGLMNLDQLIQIKRTHFDIKSDPYFKVFDYVDE